MKIWLDDERPIPNGWLGVKTPEMCIAIIEIAFHNGETVEILSLDHDLGLIDPDTLQERTGYDVLLWLEKYPKMMPKEVRIHSANPVAQRRMNLALDAIKRRNK